MSKPVIGVPVLKGDGRVLCYACTQNEEWVHGLDDWMPDDPENFPVKCSACEVILIHPSQYTPAVPAKEG